MRENAGLGVEPSFSCINRFLLAMCGNMGSSLAMELLFSWIYAFPAGLVKRCGQHFSSMVFLNLYIACGPCETMRTVRTILAVEALFSWIYVFPTGHVKRCGQ